MQSIHCLIALIFTIFGSMINDMEWKEEDKSTSIEMLKKDTARKISGLRYGIDYADVTKFLNQPERKDNLKIQQYINSLFNND